MSQSPYPTCWQVMASGFLCGSPAMKNQIFCHHHQRDRQRQANLRAGLAAKFRAGEEDLNAEIVASLDLPAPDDPEAVVVCLSNTFRALAAGAIPTKRAALMIYNLQTVNSAMYNLLKHREQLAKQQRESGVVTERAVTDPEPIASFLSSNRQADYEFSAQQYAQRLETEKQMPTADDTDGTDHNGSRQDCRTAEPDTTDCRTAELRNCGIEDQKQTQPITAETRRRPFDSAQGRLGGAKEASTKYQVPSTKLETTTAEAAFNADAARMQALEHGDLARPAEAPHSPDEVSEAVAAMTSDDWEKYIERLWLTGAITSPQRDKLHARIFHADRNVRAAARFLALKYAPGKVREVLAHGSQSSVTSSQIGSEEQIA